MFSNMFDQFIPTYFIKLPISLMSGLLAVLWISLLQKTHWATTRSKAIKLTLESMYKELLSGISNNQAAWTKWLFSAFVLILALNVSSLIPYTFAPTAHLSITFSLSIPLWLSVQMVGIFFNWKAKVSHLVPEGTPAFLIPFMVVIETMSLLIQPLTLGFRLGAKLLAGHLLIFLCSCVVWALVSTSPLGLMGFILLFALFALEMAVAFIQAGVFIILTKQYLEDNLH